MKRLNRKFVHYNVVEAREQLQGIEALLVSDRSVSDAKLQVMVEHAYHHLNFAWHVRHVPRKKCANPTDRDFNKWSKYPKEIEEYNVD